MCTAFHTQVMDILLAQECKLSSGLVILEIQKAEFGNFTVPVNSTLVCHASFGCLAADTRPCVGLFVKFIALNTELYSI